LYCREWNIQGGKVILVVVCGESIDGSISSVGGIEGIYTSSSGNEAVSSGILVD
jgi:hypothetical protein